MTKHFSMLYIQYEKMYSQKLGKTDNVQLKADS